MAYYDSDRALQEIHDEMYAEEARRPKTGFAALDNTSKFWVGLFAAAVLLMVFFDKITFQQGLVIGGVGAIALYLMKGTTEQRRELTWLESQIRIHDLLKFLQDHPIGSYQQIPKGEVRVTPVGRKQWYEGQGFKRSFGVNIYDDEIDIEEQYFVEIDIYTGDIITFKHQPEGVRGDETKDIKIIPAPEAMMVKKRDEYLGKGYSGKPL